MKPINMLSILFITTMFVGCKKNETTKATPSDTTKEDVSIRLQPRASDTHFELALKAYNEGNKPEAVKQINEGANALDKEAGNETGLNKVNLDIAIAQLRDIAGKLDDDFDISVEGLKGAIANAEVNIGHKYLASEDVYVLIPKDQVKRNELLKALDQNIKNLDEGTSKLKGDAKSEGEKLDVEGKKLKQDFEDLQKRAEDHAKRTEAHFKKYQPEYIYVW